MSKVAVLSCEIDQVIPVVRFYVVLQPLTSRFGFADVHCRLACTRIRAQQKIDAGLVGLFASRKICKFCAWAGDRGT